MHIVGLFFEFLDCRFYSCLCSKAGYRDVTLGGPFMIRLQLRDGWCVFFTSGVRSRWDGGTIRLLVMMPVIFHVSLVRTRAYMHLVPTYDANI
jgi:hypothetical protein